jgi:hypothetical protein
MLQFCIMWLHLSWTRQLKQSQSGTILPGGCIAFLARSDGKEEMFGDSRAQVISAIKSTLVDWDI